MENLTAQFQSMPLWGQILSVAITTLALAMVLTSDNETKWWSAHQLGKRDRAAYVILALAGAAIFYGLAPVFKNLHRVNLMPYWVSIRSFIPYLGVGLVAFIGCIIWITRRK